MEQELAAQLSPVARWALVGAALVVLGVVVFFSNRADNNANWLKHCRSLKNE